MKKMISRWRVLAAATAAFVASMSFTACITSNDAETPATEQVSPSENSAAATDEASADNTAKSNDANIAANGNTASGNNASGEGAKAKNAANADPFADALNNSAQGAPANPTATPAPGAAGAELQGLVIESAPKAATGSAPAPDAVGSDPFAPAPAPEGSTASAAPVPAPEPSPASVPPATGDGGGGGVASLPEMGTLMPYYIRRGDTLGDIAAAVYGDKSQWRKLAEENKLSDPSRIYAGDVLFYTLTEKSKNFATAYEASGRTTMTVSKGDTLSSIAAKVLGSQQEWRTLWKMNPRLKNPDRLVVGMVLAFRSGSNEKKTAQNAIDVPDEDNDDNEAEAQADANGDDVFVAMAQ